MIDTTDPRLLGAVLANFGPNDPITPPLEPAEEPPTTPQTGGRKTYNATIVHLLKSSPYKLYAAHSIVRQTGLSFSTVRDTLNRLRAAGLVERDMDIGLNGHALSKWYWCVPGSEAVEYRAAPLSVSDSPEQAALTAVPDPRTTLTALLKMALDEWKECGLSTPYDVALAHLARLLTPPTGYFLTCPSCGGPHTGWQCPQVKEEKQRQIRAESAGRGIARQMRQDRARFLRCVARVGDGDRQAMAGALESYLTAQTHLFTGAPSADRILAFWANENAVSLSDS